MADVEEKPAKEVANAKQEEDDEESSEEELGLLEKPIEILNTARERKKVERLSLEPTSKTPKKEGIDYSQGRGIKLGDLEIVKYELDRTLAHELKPLHRLLYKKDGKASMIKKNIRAFCGFPFEKDTKQYEDLAWAMEKFTNVGLQRLCEIFGLEQKGKRDELKEKVLNFIMEPYQTSKKVPVKVKKDPKKSKKKKSKKTSDKSAKKKKSKETANDDDDDDDDEGNDEVDDDGDEDDGNASDEAEEEPDEKKSKKKDSNKEKKKSKPKKSKATVIKLPTPSKKRKEKDEKPKKKTPKKSKKRETEDSSDDEPLAKKAKSEAPSDEVIEQTVKELLEGADLETVTMKMICKQVFDKFPGHDLTERKPFIKETVKQIIS